MPLAVDALRAACATQKALPLWMAHIWQRLHDHKKLGLILGAGTSVDAGCPAWSGLVKRLTRRARGSGKAMKAHRKSGLQDTYITQILYQLHSDKVKAKSNLPAPFERYQAHSTWLELVHKDLYRDVPTRFDPILRKHRYLKALGELVYRSRFSVNFNFDDIVDEAAIRYAQSITKVSPEIIWWPKIETRRNAPVIYHVNGLIPREKERHRSDFLVFTEDAFAEVLVSPSSLQAEFITSRFATMTFLLLGNSLNDNSLKNMLRAGTKRNGANHHYIIYWENPQRPRSAEQKRHLFDVNLKVYNLVSIFLNTKAIGQFLALLNTPGSKEFEGHIMKLCNDELRRRYYLVGSVASGKSSILEALRCFTTIEEWDGRPPAAMYQDFAPLTKSQLDEIDDWLFAQLRSKNDKMKNALPGIYVMDRGYLDLFAFSKNMSDNIAKASKMRKAVQRAAGDLVPGHIIFVEASDQCLSERQAKRGRLKGKGRAQKIEYDGKKLRKQSALLQDIYRPAKQSIFDTSRETCEETSRRIAQLILFGPYEPFNFEKRIDEIVKNGGVP